MTEQKTGIEHAHPQTTPLTDKIINTQVSDYGEVEKIYFDDKIQRWKRAQVLRGWYDNSKMQEKSLELGRMANPEKPGEEIYVTYWVKEVSATKPDESEK